MAWQVTLTDDDRVTTISAEGDLKQSAGWTYVVDDEQIVCCVPNDRILYIHKSDADAQVTWRNRYNFGR
jgi:hypothetical protein